MRSGVVPPGQRTRSLKTAPAFGAAGACTYLARESSPRPHLQQHAEEDCGQAEGDDHEDGDRPWLRREQERDRILATLTEPPDGSGGGWGGAPAGRTTRPSRRPTPPPCRCSTTTRASTRRPTGTAARTRTPSRTTHAAAGPRQRPRVRAGGQPAPIRAERQRTMTAEPGRTRPPPQSGGHRPARRPCDDVHIVVSQLHEACIDFHNTVLPRVDADPSIVPGAASAFEAAQHSSAGTGSGSSCTTSCPVSSGRPRWTWS